MVEEKKTPTTVTYKTDGSKAELQGLERMIVMRQRQGASPEQILHNVRMNLRVMINRS